MPKVRIYNNVIRVAVLIQAHRNPEQLARLCGRLRHESVDIYAHIDLKSSIKPFKELIPQATYIGDRVDVQWGGFSQVVATLNSLKQIQASTTKYDYILFISGQDYPILSINQIVDQIEQAKGKGYIFGRMLTNSKEDFYTCRCYKNRYYPVQNKILGLVVNKLVRMCSIVKRRYPFAEVCKGSSWWCLTGSCVKYILDFCDNNPKYIRFHKRVCCSDEFFFQNIVANSPFAEAELRSEQNHFTYMDWSQHKPNPKTFTVADYDTIISSGRWFARKLDMESDAQLFDLIDRHVEQGS